jgi:diguanylate cyclase (GGDEF)-like protein
MDPITKKFIWITWLLFVPVGFYLIYFFFPPLISGVDFDLFAFILLISFVASVPMVVNNTPIFLIQWVSLAVFLTFGLFIEMILVQIGVIVLLLKLRVTKQQLYRFPLNSLMFFVCSLLSGMIYYLLGGVHGLTLVENPKLLLIAITYAVVNYILNQLILSGIRYALFKQKQQYFGKDFIWETITAILTLPIGLVLYTLYIEVGVVALLFVGIPFASLSIILNLYYSTEKVNNYLQKAAEIGHELAEKLDVDRVMGLFLQKIKTLLPVEEAFVLDKENSQLHMIRMESNNREFHSFETVKPLKKGEGISGKVWADKNALIFSSRREWKSITKEPLSPHMESVLCVPIVKSNEVIGILLLASSEKRAYEKSQLMILEILCSYLAVAVENARHYEKAKDISERCALTNLYNYRYLDNELQLEYEKLVASERNKISLILLDIDHFKTVNDTYGHQSGNEILREVAGRLVNLVGNKGTVARYGGEEFTILLPDVDKQEAIKLAELVRLTIANWPFTLEQHISEKNKKLLVNITASIGVATSPDDAEDPQSLIRHADRALYVGAKRAGRNRVAQYVK